MRRGTAPPRISARSRRPTRRWRRSSAPILEQGGNGRTLVVVTGDHGESLGDHGEQTHGLFAYDATLRVPLIVYQPRLFASRVVNDPVRHVDILPTVLDAMGIAPPQGLDGASLLAAMETGGVPTRRRISRPCPRHSTGDGRLYPVSRADR